MFFKSINDEPYYLGGQVMPGTISRVFDVFWRTILRRKGSSLNVACTRYSPQQMADFAAAAAAAEPWPLLPALKVSPHLAGFSSLCHWAQLPQKMSQNGSHIFIPRTRPFLKEHHLFQDSTTSLESARFACHKTATTATILICEPQSNERFERLEG